MLLNNRVIHDDNGTLVDLSKKLNNAFSSSVVLPFVAADDYIYLGSEFPFNHRYFLIDVANGVDTVASVEIWNGSSWVPAVDVIDQTEGDDGVSFSQSGILSWVTNRTKAWSREDTTENMTGSGLETLKIYNLYWVRISFDGDFDVTTSVKYVGHKFSTDEDLGGQYPDLVRTNVKAAFKSGKTNWDEQHIIAAEQIISDLRKRQIILSGNQILDWDFFTDAAIHKVAEIAYTAFGADYEDRKKNAREAYDEAMDKVVFPVDKNVDGHRDIEETVPSYGRVRRT